MELDKALSLPEGPGRTTAIVAWIQSLFDEGTEVPVLVGGAAIEIFTGGAYTTGDLDFVGSVPRPIGAILESNGFERAGRHWIHREGQVFVEFPGSSLGPDERHVRYSAFGHEVVLVSIEDLLVDRLGAWEYWKSGIDGANAFVLLRRCRDEIDFQRLKARARQAGFEAAMSSLLAFDKKWSSSDPNDETLEEWANRGPQEGDG
jgi:hypothetical protein